MFRVSTGDTEFLTRAGSFVRDPAGRLVAPNGMTLMDASGAELRVGQGALEIDATGMVIEDGEAVGRIAVAMIDDPAALTPVGGSLFTAPLERISDHPAPHIRQGHLEGANSDLAADMVEIMAALRAAETAARLIQTYDSLLGQATGTLGRGGR